MPPGELSRAPVRASSAQIRFDLPPAFARPAPDAFGPASEGIGTVSENVGTAYDVAGTASESIGTAYEINVPLSENAIPGIRR